MNNPKLGTKDTLILFPANISNPSVFLLNLHLYLENPSMLLHVKFPPEVISLRAKLLPSWWRKSSFNLWEDRQMEALLVSSFFLTTFSDNFREKVGIFGMTIL